MFALCIVPYCLVKMTRGNESASEGQVFTCWPEWVEHCFTQQKEVQSMGYLTQPCCFGVITMHIVLLIVPFGSRSVNAQQCKKSVLHLHHRLQSTSQEFFYLNNGWWALEESTELLCTYALVSGYRNIAYVGNKEIGDYGSIIDVNKRDVFFSFTQENMNPNWTESSRDRGLYPLRKTEQKLQEHTIGCVETQVSWRCKGGTEVAGISWVTECQRM